MYVSDSDLLKFLWKARETGLQEDSTVNWNVMSNSTRSAKKSGLIFVKENVSEYSSNYYSNEDFSLTRTTGAFCDIFK